MGRTSCSMSTSAWSVSLPVALALVVAVMAPAPARAASEALPSPGLASDPSERAYSFLSPAGNPDAVGAPRAQGYDYGYRRRPLGYQPPTGPTRDQTSPFGLEVQGGAMTRRVKERGVTVTGGDFRFDVDSARVLVKATLRPAPFFEVYGLAGGADLHSGFEDANFDGDFRFAWGGGARITFFRDPNWYDTTVFVEGRYLQFESEADGIEFLRDVNGDGVLDVVTASEKFRWREWEGRFGVSWRFYLSRPYLGVRYSDAEADDIVDQGGPLDQRLGRLRATRHIGGFAGIDLYFDPSRRVGLTAEITFPDQVSGFAGLRVWF